MEIKISFRPLWRPPSHHRYATIAGTAPSALLGTSVAKREANFSPRHERSEVLSIIDLNTDPYRTGHSLNVKSK